MSNETPPAQSLRVLAADEDHAALETTAETLRGLGHEVTSCAASVREACEQITRDEPDVAVVVVHEDAEHALDLIEELSEVAAGPVIALLGEEDARFAGAAAERGIAAVTTAPTPEALQSALEVAVRRHAEAAQLTEQVGQLENALERRAVIERAKGILMERHGLPERGAFELVRGHARSRSVTVLSVAREVAEGLDIRPLEAGRD